MASASTWLARSREIPPQGAVPVGPAPKPQGLFARLGQAIAGQRRREAERLAADLIERSGGHLTDALEREIGNRSLQG